MNNKKSVFPFIILIFSLVISGCGNLSLDKAGMFNIKQTADEDLSENYLYKEEHKYTPDDIFVDENVCDIGEEDTLGFPLKKDRIYDTNGLGWYPKGGFHRPFLTNSVYGYVKDDRAQDNNPTYIIDIGGAFEGEEIYAVADGVVVEARFASASGNYAVIKHDENGKITYSYYGHMRDTALVKKGQQVYKEETLIGYVGQTGEATGPHLHFEWYGHDPYCEYLRLGYISPYNHKNNNHGPGHDSFDLAPSVVKSFDAYLKNFEGNSVYVDEVELVYPRTDRARELDLCKDEDIDVPDVYNPDNTYMKYDFSQNCTFELVGFDDYGIVMKSVSKEEFFNNYGSFGGLVLIETTDCVISKISETYMP